ncbi:hypothetical protein P168DRAFT_315735 [Aspergillus campestris IBT 28561]|uniref:Zn(2)-C6 fungal-type domain-containing protein n=1 Tax=Aspergillus campestris (strain IBT 28561) TaxID=1392248 RepID=A0A2I1DBI1_ASPC2|nr:uncharacterized protein P168DRAFT_315735 [Aspergillus campestris IBT 28561]PKY07221.1 hypothetical protein P168DRAFT_315735 [Aspergillus campestris IBT 28561]
MNRDRVAKLSPDPQTKSVKRRSTCNACQQAKIRCSHDKPSCRRCQKNNFECVYSMSRRLGRPAKKRDGLQSLMDQQPGERGRHQPIKRIRYPKKKKVKEEQSQEKLSEDSFLDDGASITFDKIPFDDGAFGTLSGDDAGLQRSLMEGDREPSFVVPEPIDFSSDTWLQDFAPHPIPDSTQEPSLLDTFGVSSPKLDITFATFSAGLKDLATPVRNYQDTPSDAQGQPPVGYYAPQAGFLSPSEGPSQGANGPLSVYPENVERDLFEWSQSLSSSMENLSSRHAMATDYTGVLGHGKIPARQGEYTSFTSEEMKNSAGPFDAIPRQNQCQCHEQTIGELMRVNMCASRTGPSITIDSVLNCQRRLQQLSDTILQCAVCSKTRVNLLMVVVVSIDSLITTLEAIISVESGRLEGLFPEYSEQLLTSYRQDISTSTDSRRFKAGAFHFKAHIDSCPLVVGGFCVPSDEKFFFVKQVLHTRLSGLLAIVRRIRSCTQELLAISASRGRLIMMMETDRRLQLIMMKMKMLTRR